MDPWNRPQVSENPAKPECSCARCKPMYFNPGTLEVVNSRFIVCEHCGNKRCPHASWHGFECTGSNEPGQLGSDYE